MIFPLKKAITISSIRDLLDNDQEKLYDYQCPPITHVGFPEESVIDSIICFISDKARAELLLQNLKGRSVVFTTHEIYEAYKHCSENCIFITCVNPRNTFAIVIDQLVGSSASFENTIADLSTNSDKNISIGLNTVIDECVDIGSEVSIGPNCSIGGSGFGYYTDRNGDKKRFPHFGRVIIEDDVEIDSNVSIDRGVFGDTIIARGSKIGSLVHIAHNAQISTNVIMAPHSKLCGSVSIGKGSYIAPGVIIRQSKTIGDFCIVGMGAMVTKDFPSNSLIYGNPARLIKKIEATNNLPV